MFILGFFWLVGVLGFFVCFLEVLFHLGGDWFSCVLNFCLVLDLGGFLGGVVCLGFFVDLFDFCFGFFFSLLFFRNISVSLFWSHLIIAKIISYKFF